VKFEWDESKRILTLAKHGIDFGDVVFVFDDPDRIENIDNRKDYGEIRINTIGLIKNELIVTVAHTDRNGIIRIISARRASRKERRMYYGNR